MTIAPLRLGQTVRIVEMRGCMADVRNNVRWGVVTGFQSRVPHGSTQPWPYVTVDINGDAHEFPATSNYWSVNRDDGVLENLDG